MHQPILRPFGNDRSVAEALKELAWISASLQLHYNRAPVLVQSQQVDPFATKHTSPNGDLIIKKQKFLAEVMEKGVW